MSTDSTNGLVLSGHSCSWLYLAWLYFLLLRSTGEATKSYPSLKRTKWHEPVKTGRSRMLYSDRISISFEIRISTSARLIKVHPINNREAVIPLQISEILLLHQIPSNILKALAPGRFGSNFRNIIFNLKLQIDILSTSNETGRKCMHMTPSVIGQYW